MKIAKRALTFFLSAILTLSAWAVPAYRGWQERTLTDGTPITIRQIGDEFYHFWETEDGKIALEQEDGTFVISSERTPSAKTIKRNRAKSPYMVRPIRKVGEHNMAPRGLVILVNFSDVSFKAANNQAAFNDLMNSTNYTHNSASGSVREYFRAQSNGTYVPDFDVVGPVTLTSTRATYGANTTSKRGSDINPAQMIVDACNAVNSTVDFATYDNDKDTYIDFVYVIYAGEGEADGGPAESIWPHNWYVRSGANISCTLDGKKLDNYACSAELNHSDKSRTGIGTIAHEFGHVIGMPDYYDTDYGTNDDNGVTPYRWSIMDQGSYNNSGRTPPNYSIFDKYYMGWATPKFLAKNAKSNVTMTAGYDDAYQITGGTSGPVAYTNTSTIYYIENRQQSGWDAYIPGSGMLVWKVKFSQSAWSNNEPNNEAGNPRYTIVPADGKTTDYGQNASDVFPRAGITSYTPISGCALSEITKSGSNITFKYNGGEDKTRATYEFIAENCTTPADGEVAINAPLSVTITPNSGYTLDDASCWTVEMGGVELTYGTGFTYNASTNTFYIASLTDDVVIMAEAKVVRTVTWSVQGITSTTTFADGATLILPSNPADCSGGKKFVGWTANSTVSGSAPTDLFTEAGSKTVTANITYYAVYTTACGSGSGSSTTYEFSISTSDFSGSSYADNNGEHTSTAYDVTDNTNTMSVYWTSYNVSNQSGMQWKKSGSYIYNSTDLGKINSVTITGDALTQYYGTSAEPTNTSLGTNDGYFKVTNATSGALHTTSLTVNFTKSTGAGTSYSDYSLTCTECEKHTITWKACGDVYQTDQVCDGSALVLPDAPGGFEGLTFVGWTATEHHTGASAPAIISAGSAVNADVTYYAVFH